MSLGILLVVCGTTAVAFPVLFLVAAISVLAVVLMIAGTASIIGSFWAGKWSGVLVHLIVGLLYIAAGLVVTEQPRLVTLLMITIFIAILFMVMGAFASWRSGDPLPAMGLVLSERRRHVLYRARHLSARDRKLPLGHRFVGGNRNDPERLDGIMLAAEIRRIPSSFRCGSICMAERRPCFACAGALVAITAYAPAAETWRDNASEGVLPTVCRRYTLARDSGWCWLVGLRSACRTHYTSFPDGNRGL